ncbi:hypothetical protein Mtc_0600 [Methanocella conradii HZ254]|uniref:Uncharacterized protein n=1 Tax=Methanocella conradii (strain DSM 24694 / JCM 17849 / CGMCC 1.5162 / HZ254) TaxID=1041930 RepID=H8I5P5_METCZ|nr:hypothetical protein Mtc_0600 [Methanocella conradii HZ254]
MFVEAESKDNCNGNEGGNGRPGLAQVDDSGIGSPVGGVAVGVLDATKGEFKYKLVGVEYFQDGYRNEYQDRVAQGVRELFKEMGITKDAYRIEICSGHVFDLTRKWLDEEGYEWRPVKIVDPLQSLIENAFSDYLVSIGVPERIRTIEVGRDQFMYLFNWVRQDPEARVKYCKTNGSKWKAKWSHKLYERRGSVEKR